MSVHQQYLSRELSVSRRQVRITPADERRARLAVAAMALRHAPDRSAEVARDVLAALGLSLPLAGAAAEA